MEQYLLTMSNYGYNSFSAQALLTLNRTLWLNGIIDEQQSLHLVSALLYLDSLDCAEITLLSIRPPLRRNTGKDINVINKDTKQNKYFTAEEAIRYGLVDGIWNNF